MPQNSTIETVITVNSSDESIKKYDADKFADELELSMKDSCPSFIWHANWDIKAYRMRKHKGG